MRLKAFTWEYGRQFGTLAGLVGLTLVLWALTPHFMTVSNLMNVAQQTSINAIIAVGMTLVIITAGIDLSVGSIVAFSGVVLASALQAGIPLPLALAIGLAVGAFSGWMNGLLITYGRLPPFISTLGMMSVARGSALLYTGGRPISGFSAEFRYLATGEILNIPLPVIIMVIVYLLGHIVLTRTKLGRYVYAIGGNEQAAVLSGVNVKFHKAAVYALSGLLSGLAAIILPARLNSAQP
ncbi:MAG: ribose ABC transporter permease, partial [Candidatus Marinimicrobia bacterium]|nr:ribose ABC transporter permease [Candidatus Neomarinimicrobiota bacterium]